MPLETEGYEPFEALFLGVFVTSALASGATKAPKKNTVGEGWGGLQGGAKRACLEDKACPVGQEFAKLIPVIASSALAEPG